MLEPILLVDDDPIIVDLVTTILRMGGYEVVSASDGLQALNIALEEPRISLVVSDILMPGMSGIQLCQRLKASRPGLKCILMSGYDMGMIAHDRDAHFLAKPFFPQDLLGKVEEVLALQAC